MRNSAMKFLTALGFVGALAIALPSASWGRTRAAAAFRTMTVRVRKRLLTAEVPPALDSLVNGRPLGRSFAFATLKKQGA
jgi:hypothetical protein